MSWIIFMLNNANHDCMWIVKHNDAFNLEIMCPIQEIF